MKTANFNRDKNPQRGKISSLDKKGPTCTTYPYEKIDERKVLSNKTRYPEFTIGLHPN